MPSAYRRGQSGEVIRHGVVWRLGVPDWPCAWNVTSPSAIDNAIMSELRQWFESRDLANSKETACLAWIGQASMARLGSKQRSGRNGTQTSPRSTKKRELVEWREWLICRGTPNQSASRTIWWILLKACGSATSDCNLWIDATIWYENAYPRSPLLAKSFPPVIVIWKMHGEVSARPQARQTIREPSNQIDTWVLRIYSRARTRLRWQDQVDRRTQRQSCPLSP